MSKHSIPRVEAKRVIDKLVPHMTHKKTVEYMNNKLDFFYPNSQPTKSLIDNDLDVDDKELFGDDLGMKE